MKSKIIELIPGAVYNDTVFTQSVVLELPTGDQLRVADPAMHCGEDYVSEEVEIRLEADIASTVNLSDQSSIELEPVDVDTGIGIKHLRTHVSEVFKQQGEKTPVLLELPGGELRFIFNTQRLPAGLPEGYEPEIGDRLVFKDISEVMLASVTYEQT